MKGDIVFVWFPYTDMTISKPRPALVLHEEKDEVDANLKTEINVKLASCYRL